MRNAFPGRRTFREARFWTLGLMALLVFAVLPRAAAGTVFQHPFAQWPAALARVLHIARGLQSIATGPRGAPRLYVFFDPNCPFCAHFWQSFQPWRKRFRVHWIPVAYARPSSLGRAVAILHAPDPAAVLDQNERDFHFQTHLGGIMPAYRIPLPLQKAIQQNTHYWLRELGTLPACLYAGRRGPHLMVGTPSPAQWQQMYQQALPGTPTGGKTP